jgi:hypothetical protein
MRIDSDGKLLSPDGSAFFGTVSDSGNGAIMERGSNANGEFVKYADGTQICTFRFSIGIPDNWTVSAFPAQQVYAWTFPSAFISDPAVTASGGQAEAGTVSTTGNINISVARPESTTTTTVNISAKEIRSSSGTTGAGIHATAIGRWY